MPTNKKKTMRVRATEASSAVFDHIKDKVEFYAMIVTFIGTLFGGYFWFDTTYAKASDLKNTDSRLEQKILEDRYESLDKHIWSIQDQYRNITKAPAEIRQELRDLQNKRDRVKNRLDEIDKQVGVSK
jgi:peptidoglycan hydrolase CwlO-like protein